MRGTKWCQRYEGSAAQDLLHALGAVEFGDRIILFGAALLPSVLPLIILLGALASSRVDDDIARHLGLGRQGTGIMEGLFRTSSVSFNLGILVSLLLSLAGTIAVARSVQVIYEGAFEQAHARGAWNLLSLLRLGCSARGVAHPRRRDQSSLTERTSRSGNSGLVDFVLLTLFFWWSIHFLLAGRESWTRVDRSLGGSDGDLLDRTGCVCIVLPFLDIGFGQQVVRQDRCRIHPGNVVHCDRSGHHAWCGCGCRIAKTEIPKCRAIGRIYVKRHSPARLVCSVWLPPEWSAGRKATPR